MNTRQVTGQLRYLSLILFLLCGSATAEDVPVATAEDAVESVVEESGGETIEVLADELAVEAAESVEAISDELDSLQSEIGAPPEPGTIETVNSNTLPEEDSAEPDLGAEIEVPSLTLLESDPETDLIPKQMKDMVLVLDNSGSMKKNDPQFLTRQAVTAFIERLDESTRLSIIIFDQDVRLAEPFQQVSPENRANLMSSLDAIDYKGLYTDSPAAIERAIYELKNSGQEDSKKLIVFMTDGIVDTGKAEMDVEKAKWLKQDLAADAAENGIVMFGIAFTEAADFQLIQSLAQQTDGEYYRALAAEDLNNVFEKINAIINKPPEPEPEPVVEPIPVTPVEVAPEVIQEPPPAPVIIEVPVQVEDENAGLRSTMLMAAVGVMILALIAILILLIRRSKSRPEEEQAYVQQAFLNDIHGHTHESRFELGSRPTMLGRVDSKENDHLNHIVIPQSTIGRRHAMIEYKDYGFWIIDQGSINGTFVNDRQIDGETRLKHGDRVRLHKFEFEFVVPELDEDGMTQISNTVFAGAGAAAIASEDATVARAAATPANESNIDEMPEPDFDLDMDDDTGDIDIPEFPGAVETGPQPVDDYIQTEKRHVDDIDLDITDTNDDDSEDETFINPNSYDGASTAENSVQDSEQEGPDETIILHDDFDDDTTEDGNEDDATIRRSSDDDDERFKETDIYPTDDR